MPAFQPSVLLGQLQALNASPAAIAALPPDVRLALSTAAQETSRKLETPSDTLARLLLGQPIESVCVRIAADLKLFTILSKNKQPQSVDELAQATKADPILLFEQDETGLFSISPTLTILARPELAEAWGPCYDFLGDIYRSFPSYLAQTKYQNPVDPNNTSVQKAYNAPNTPFMDILFQHPRELQGFATLMSVWADGFNQVGTLYPVQEKLIDGFDMSLCDVMFVDVGGGFGQKSLAFKRAFPQSPGRVVVQDLPSSINNVPINDDESYRGIEFAIHDFMTEQPIKNARCYYIRQCLHNWNDEKSILILKHLAAAMRDGYSRLLIHEIIVPEKGAGTWVTWQDIEMMGMFATGERTRAQWEYLCTQAGLKVKEYHLDGHPSCKGIIEVEKL